MGRAPSYLVWNALAIAAILITSRKQHSGTFWQFAHDWLPTIFFITAFEEVSFLALIVRGVWQNAYLIALESALTGFAGLALAAPGKWRQDSSRTAIGRARELNRSLADRQGCQIDPFSTEMALLWTDCLPRAQKTWLLSNSATADVTMSVCNGASMLAKYGLLDGLTATTHHMYAANMQKQYPAVRFVSGTRFVENGKVATAGGLTSGIDLALHVVERYYGQEVAQVTANFMEYRGELWKNPDFNQVKPVVAAK